MGRILNHGHPFVLTLYLDSESIGWGVLSVFEDTLEALERERRARKLETVPEAVRAVLGEYFKTKAG